MGKDARRSIKGARMTRSSKSQKRVKPGTNDQGKRAGGRPSNYSEALADKICLLLSEGQSLLTICKREDMPARGTVMRWLAEDAHAGFRDKYARAREEQADFYAAQIVEIADEDIATVSRKDDEGNEIEVSFDSTAVQRNRLRVDARKWYASKLAPKKYGDKLGIGQAEGLDPASNVTRIEIVALTNTDG